MTKGGAQAPAEVGELADRIAAAVTACPSVAGLGRVPGIPVATYLPGRTVSGVAVRPGAVEVCVVARFGVPLPQVAAHIRQAVAPLVPGRTVDVVIADITGIEAPVTPATAPPSAVARRPPNEKREESVHG